MTSEQELWACAAEVLKQYGERAPLHIAERIGALALAGDWEGVSAWRLIAAKVDQMQRSTEMVQ